MSNCQHTEENCWNSNQEALDSLNSAHCELRGQAKPFRFVPAKGLGALLWGTHLLTEII